MLGYVTKNSLFSCIGVLAALTFSVAGPAAAAGTGDLSPKTKIRVSIIQWMPTKGAYEKWDALGGEFTIAPDATLTLPVIGTLSVADLTSTALSEQIAARLKEKIGLTNAPEATVEIVAYPPIYVVGDVTAPGEYQFQAGLTVLQALAMSGGERRLATKAEAPQGATGLVGQLREMDNGILRGEITVARLRAEMAGDKQIDFNPATQQNKALAAGIFKQEQAVFASRANVLARQAKSFTDLRTLLEAEIDTTEKKILSNDEDIASVQKELSDMKGLVERGIWMPSRLTDIQRMLRTYQADRLDLQTAIMRARQNIAEATRNLDGLYDKQQTEVASDLQLQQANLDQLKMKRETAQKLLLEYLSNEGASGDQTGEPALNYTVVRQTGEKVEELPADETTMLQPGDVVRIKKQAMTMENSDPVAAGLSEENSQ